ncbi:hypothetical protein KIN20_023323 [Parelaphostrongylus tenuis]|uniref:Uncharacterized protein n=1 Tax=Parelaphostrongylus tenuis TaxID=148309 RepID=A0AAD5NC42_PARTN|nr:hypothetical protein KIN20_023323 [Parelaphostrongylus tenuis]
MIKSALVSRQAGVDPPLRRAGALGRRRPESKEKRVVLVDENAIERVPRYLFWQPTTTLLATTIVFALRTIPSSNKCPNVVDQNDHKKMLLIMVKIKT